MDIIKVENLSFFYKSGEDDSPDFQALDNINLTIKKGEFLAILGHNGSGKSTLAKLFNAILIPTEGDIWVKDMNTKDEEHLYDIRRTAGMVFQNPDNQIVATIVEEDVAFAPENLGVPPAEIRELVDGALKTVGMYDYIKHAPHMLSGGQKQRIAIAGVLAMSPEVLVLDEPTAMLDPQGRREIMQTIRRLNEEQGMTVVLVTHYMDEAAKADRIVVMNSGKIEQIGTPREIFSQVEELKSIGLDVPQSTELLYELNRAGQQFRGDILEVDECVEEICALRARA
ncbi:MAG: energy-coupling factor transporter ATPase [Oscillospiraceae bacterium]|nr:energy-coupling factor transporter ATPase [Oscillospiraceae bacterium]